MPNTLDVRKRIGVTMRTVVVVLATLSVLNAPTGPGTPSEPRLALGQMIRIITGAAVPREHVQHPVDLSSVGKLFGITRTKPPTIR